MRMVIYVLAVLISALFTGCSASGHKYYDAFKYSPPTSRCQVIWVHSYEAAKYRLDHELPKVEILGKSTFTTSRSYNERAASEDCKKAGGDYIIVIAEGYQGSRTSQFTLQSTKTYYANSNNSYSGGFSYGNTYGNYYGNSTTRTSYQLPTYDTYNITVSYYGYSYYVYRELEDFSRYY